MFNFFSLNPQDNLMICMERGDKKCVKIQCISLFTNILCRWAQSSYRQCAMLLSQMSRAGITWKQMCVCIIYIQYMIRQGIRKWTKGCIQRCLMAQWFRAHGRKCAVHDPEVMGLKPCWVNTERKRVNTLQFGKAGDRKWVLCADIEVI